MTADQERAAIVRRDNRIVGWVFVAVGFYQQLVLGNDTTSAVFLCTAVLIWRLDALTPNPKDQGHG